MLRLILILGYNILRYSVNRIRYGIRYQSKWIERISGRAEIKLHNKGCINLGSNIELAPYVDIQVHGEGNLSIGNKVYMN